MTPAQKEQFKQIIEEQVESLGSGIEEIRSAIYPNKEGRHLGQSCPYQFQAGTKHTFSKV